MSQAFLKKPWLIRINVSTKENRSFLRFFLRVCCGSPYVMTPKRLSLVERQRTGLGKIAIDDTLRGSVPVRRYS